MVLTMDGGMRGTLSDNLLGKEVKSAVWKLYVGLWNAYKEKLIDAKKDFQSVLKSTNNLTLHQLARYTKKYHIDRRTRRTGAGVGVGAAGG